jgi:hypothetical protein
MAKKKDDIKDEELLAKLRDRFYDPKPGETDWSKVLARLLVRSGLRGFFDENG